MQGLFHLLKAFPEVFILRDKSLYSSHSTPARIFPSPIPLLTGEGWERSVAMNLLMAMSNSLTWES
jgi:hypothetical protein